MMDYTTMFRLDGKTAIVTGAAAPQGIGAAVTEALATQGCDVIMADMKEANSLAQEIAARTGRRIFSLPVDVSSDDSVREMTQKAIETFGHIDILVNNAGISLPINTFTTPLDGEWQKMIDVNMNGALRCVRNIVPHMVENGIKGSIINTASTRGIRPSGPETGHAYSVTKAGLLMLTRAWALEFARVGIRVNAVCPGFVRTDISRMWYESPQMLKKVEGRIPLGKMAEASEIAGAYAFLASPAACNITGAILMTDGGQECSMNWVPDWWETPDA